MTTIKDIFTTNGPEYIQRFGDHMSADHPKVIDAIYQLPHGSLRRFDLPMRPVR